MNRFTVSPKAAVVLCVLFFAALFTLTAEAAQISMPSYANGGDLQSSIDATGSKIYKILISINVAVGIFGIIWAGLAFAAGDGEKGKQRLGYAVIGLIITAVASGIAAMAIGA